jgi:hypothetical protein
MYSQSSIHRQLITIKNCRYLLAGRPQKIMVQQSIGCSFKLILKFGVENSIVNAPLVHRQTVIRGAFTIDSSTPTLRTNLNEYPLLSESFSKVLLSILI